MLVQRLIFYFEETKDLTA